MKTKSKTAAIYTLGCKVNQYESEAISEELARLGISVQAPTSVCDAYIINTCTVTAESDRKARQFIRRAISKNPDARIVVTGCLAQTSAEALSAIEGIDAIVGNTEKLRCAELVSKLLEKEKEHTGPKISVSPIDDAPFEQMSITSFDRTRAYVKIEDGCENRCTYCIIPSARGRVRSKDPGCVLHEVRALTLGGCREVVLTGIETASYGRDIGKTSLGDLLTEVDKIENVGRVRLGSLDPSLIKEDFVKKIAPLHSLAPHFHLSLQSGSNRILALMKRKYNRDQAMKAIELLRASIPDVQFTTDVIVGFPGETDEDFSDTCDFIERAGFLNVHIFPYSKRKGTPAAQMKDQIPEEIKKNRLHILEQIVAKCRMSILNEKIRESAVKEVLFETYKDGFVYGHTAEFIEVAARSDAPMHAELINVKLTHTDGNICYGEILPTPKN